MKATWGGLDEWISAETKAEMKMTADIINEVKNTAMRIERDSKMVVAVDTGELRSSITTDMKVSQTSIEAEVGTDVSYSEVVEFGGGNQRAQPYLVPSFDKNVNDLESNIEKILKGDD